MSNNRELLARDIARRFTEKISGDNEMQFVGQNPEDKIFVGKLSPRSSNSDFKSSVLIKQIGVNFRVDKGSLASAELEIQPKGFFFYRAIPTLTQQRTCFLDTLNESLDKNYLSFDELITAYDKCELVKEETDFSTPVVPIYNKVSISDFGSPLKVVLADIYDSEFDCGSIQNDSEFYVELKSNVDSLRKYISNQPDVVPCMLRDKVKIKDLISNKTWEDYIQKQINRETGKMNYMFDYSVTVDAKGVDDLIDIVVSFSNETNFGDETSGYGMPAAKKDHYRINTLFNSGFDIKYKDLELKPIELDYFADDYKYDCNVYAVGNNCNVDWDLDNNLISTVHVPVFVQKRLKTRDDINVKFVDLIESPYNTLMGIYNQMIKELSVWKNDYEKRKDLTEKGKIQYNNEIQNFELEIKRFKTGIDLIKSYNMVKTAFVDMNLAFSRSSKGYDSWRLFQIVFIVSLLLDIVANEPDIMLDDDIKGKAKTDEVDILYFPTGGGKTEAFLGILVFNLFFDRLRSKNYGVTAWLKYPLRLLSVQQVQRVSNILAVAELIRKEQDLGGSEFSLGYFVGDGNTPNSIDEGKAKEISSMSHAELDEKYRLLDVCPYCGLETIHVTFDKDENSLKHICSNENCKSGGIIPLYMVDYEIYRRIPSVIISTVDKMTAIGLNQRFHNLLCGASYVCPKHGFTDLDHCLVKNCESAPSDFNTVSIKDPAPTLLIQDELHLIKESLGAYDSHYETFVEYFVRNLSNVGRGVKVIGATATISAYENQAKHLYWKDAIRFPTASPYLNHNFYSYIDDDDIARIIVGYAPYGKAIVNSVAYSLQYIKTVVYHLFKHPEEVLSIPGINFDGTEDEQKCAVKKLLEDYWIILEYNNVKQESNKVLQAIDDPINTELHRCDIQGLYAKKMTGDDTFQDVRKTLSSIEHAQNIIEDIDFNMIAATSMISHGVDADRFNLMLFYGIPGNTAEYIQAYSRVGRKHTGLVVDVMRPSRAKDQSYLRHFVKFHEYKDILVDSVSINRWAEKSVEQTLPGVFTGIILNYYRYNLIASGSTLNIGLFGGLKEAIIKNEITPEDMKKHMYGVYKCSDQDSSSGKLYRMKIDSMIDNIFSDIVSSSLENNTYILSVMEHLGYHVMRSLRDTDKQIIVEMK